MKVPFFRSKNSSADGKGGKSKSRRGPTSGLEGIASESDLSLASAAMPATQSTKTNAAAPVPSAAQAIADQMVEMEGFLTTIDGFQSEARRLFPENMALGQILDELRDECRRRVDYMSRVSAPPVWLPAAAQQRPSSSSSTTIAAMAGNYHTVGASAGTPGSTSSGGGGGGGRRGLFGKGSTTRGAPAQGAVSTVSGKTGGGAPRYASVESSPMSTATVTSSSSNSSDSVSSQGRNADAGGNSGYFSRHQQTQVSNASVSAGRKPMLQLSNYASSSTGSPPSPSSPTMGTRRDSRVADQRRKTAPQSMFVSSSVADISSTIGIRGAGNRLSTAHTGSLAKFPRASMAVAGLDSPRIGRPRTSSADLLARPHSLVDANNSTHQLSTKNSASAMRGTKQRSQTQVQAHPAKASTNDYVLTIKLAGHRVEVSVSASLQSSLISLQLAKLLGMNIASVPPNSRVWSSNGKSWAIIGEVPMLPFVCGNMTFTHSFKVFQGSAATGEMVRDIMLGNDFCVGNKGRIKDNQLHLEQLCMPITVPVRQIPASS
ncbi:hypothetical protein GGI15_004209 [Coemansia interrupta]|uniref:Uncharacterized protein n=1 Tax=Coemansia interrupta TaxID=1126814 RepID=A0A9W8HB04_9FUNG|nr:hypothetical protein GGI15_004209 [Coemansia interrupta]